jgi:hypothetical protein
MAAMATATAEQQAGTPQQQNEQDEQIVISKFRNILNQFKRPYIESTDKPSAHAAQTLDVLDKVYEDIYRLYTVVRPILERNGQSPPVQPGSEEATIVAVFEQEGILAALRAYPPLKDALLRYLSLDLITYPYTLNPGHISVLDMNKIASHQTEIVDNNE